MISINSHPNAMNGSFKPSTFSCSSNGLECKPSKASIFANPNISSPTHPWSSSQLKFPDRRTKVSLSASAMVTGAEQALISLESTSESPSPKKKLRVLVKPMERPRIMLKFIWMQSNIGIALDQAIPGYGTIPLSPYYFWPRKDAWEELKVLLEGKSWISQKQMVVLLNQATDIINLWQQSGVNLS